MDHMLDFASSKFQCLVEGVQRGPDRPYEGLGL